MRVWIYMVSALRHAIRSKLVLVLLFFTAAIEYAFLKLLRATTLQMQGEVSALSQTDLVFSGLIIQTFAGCLLALVYGLWMIPYPHRGSRATLTYSLPVPRSGMVTSYGMALLVMLTLQTVITIGCLGLLTDWSFVFSSVFPWKKLGLTLLFQVVTFQFIASLLAVGALSFGQVVTFVLGTLVFVLLQVAGGVFRIEMVQMMGATMDGFQTAQKVYAWLPPVGEFLYQMRELFWNDNFTRTTLISWGAWWTLAQVLLVLRLRYPSLSRSEE